MRVFKCTWEKAIPNEMPAMVPSLFSITVVTRVKQPCTAAAKWEKKKINRSSLMDLHITERPLRKHEQTHRRVHLFLSQAHVLEGLWRALGVVSAAADRDALLPEVVRSVPVRVIFHPAAM